MKKVQITLTGSPFNNYFVPVMPGDKIILCKEDNNPCDTEAIAVFGVNTESGIKIAQRGEGTPKDLKIGYVANSVSTKANGTWSAGRLFDKICSPHDAKVLFVKERCIIAEVEIE
jgi:hypothetical protein